MTPNALIALITVLAAPALAACSSAQVDHALSILEDNKADLTDAQYASISSQIESSRPSSQVQSVAIEPISSEVSKDCQPVFRVSYCDDFGNVVML